MRPWFVAYFASFAMSSRLDRRHEPLTDAVAVSADDETVAVFAPRYVFDGAIPGASNLYADGFAP